MPGAIVGRYPVSLDAGTQVSSTYEGRHLTVLDTELIHPYRASTFVNKGDPVIVCNAGVVASRGHAVGVAFETATAATDYIAIDTEGIWNLMVYAEDDDGDSAIVAGDPLFIHDGSLGAVGAAGVGDAMISKIRNLVTQIPFGYAVATMQAGYSGVIAVKVHWDPEEQQDEHITWLAAATADNAKSYHIRDAAVEAGGMFTALQISYDNTGIKTGTCTITGINIDLSTTEPVPFYYGIQIYSGTIADDAMGFVCGLSMYFEDQGNAVSSYCMLDMGQANVHAPAARHSYIRIREHGAAVLAGSSFLLLEGANAVGYLLNFNDVAGAEGGGFVLEANTDNTADSDYHIRVRLGQAAVDRYIRLYEAG